MAEREHGTLGRYQLDRCRCRLCKDAKSAYARDRTRQMAYNRWESYVDAGPCREHVETLLAAGVKLGRIAVLAGIQASTLHKLMRGTPRSGGVPSSRVLARTAGKLLAVRLHLDDLPATAWVDAAGTRRRAQALAAIGHTLIEQAEAVGRLPANYRRVLVTDQVLAGTARAVRDLYAAWSSTPPPATWIAERTRRHAAKRGWLPPAAWDDDLIDLTDEALAAAIREQAEAMTDRELQLCHDSRYRHGDMSPLTLEASREYKRRLYRQRVEAEAS